MPNADDTLIVVFKNFAILNPARTAAEGRPIYDDREICEIRAPASRSTISPHPATEVCGWVDDPITGEQRKITYAERFSRQYRQFKEHQQQTIRGTPLDHAAFLTEGKRASLRALNVYTVEQLAGLDGQELKNLGPEGRDFKNSAMEFLAEAKNGAVNTQVLAELEALRAKTQLLEEDNEALKARIPSNSEGQFTDMTDEQIRAYITTTMGHAPQGNLNRKTLVRMATEARPTKAA